MHYRNNSSRVPQNILRLLPLELKFTSRVCSLPTHRTRDLCNPIFALHKCWACILAINPILRNRFSFTKYSGIVYTLLKILWDFKRKKSGYSHTAKHSKRLPQGISLFASFLVSLSFFSLKIPFSWAIQLSVSFSLPEYPFGVILFSYIFILYKFLCYS